MNRIGLLFRSLPSSGVFLTALVVMVAVAGSFMAVWVQTVAGPFLALGVFAVAGLVANRFALGTLESYIGVLSADVFGGIFMHRTPWALAVPGAVTGCLSAIILVGLLVRLSDRRDAKTEGKSSEAAKSHDNGAA